MAIQTLDALLALPYDVVVVPEPQSDGSFVYVATHPDLPGCMSHGSTPSEALLSLEDAKRLYIETCLELGRPVPEPSTTVTSLEVADATDTVTEHPDFILQPIG